jgi:hypothetical protein
MSYTRPHSDMMCQVRVRCVPNDSVLFLASGSGWQMEGRGNFDVPRVTVIENSRGGLCVDYLG